VEARLLVVNNVLDVVDIELESKIAWYHKI
jgi:hypothetical protein